ncbi:cytochrome b/b6 domain-containing protein [Arthrobacter sp. MA-N2]|uniref:cytochrome b/b6 domain-containing protein n=1 Tax=Arthrobacter sp. MA-N2 TaxID=1101188 RepID=UPI0004818782|nr:cytochrome b/b6 domain-containing protein [Arthrobacter sp. MA-N2]
MPTRTERVATAVNRPLTRLNLLAWLIPSALLLLAGLVLGAIYLRTLPSVQLFLADYPGHSELPESAPAGLPAWLAWQHFLNFFFLVLIIRSGWQVRTTTRPIAYWSRRTPERFRRTNQAPSRISVTLWFHLALDLLWIINGGLFVILLAVTGQWMRIVPTSWDIVPNALSAGLQYLSLDWPIENGWNNYNALQVLAYFATVFIAAPLAFLSGIRMSPVWPKGAARLNALYPITVARAIHLPVMFYFVIFVIVHVTLVFATGALRNLNHMYSGTDEVSWMGFWVFAVSLVVTIGALVGARPMLLRWFASLTGSVTR